MKNLSFLFFSALVAVSGVLAVPIAAPVPEPALLVVTETRTETRIKVIGATATTWITQSKESKNTSTTKTTTTSEDDTTTTTTTTTSSTSSTTTSSTTTEKKQEKEKEEPTPTPTPTPPKIVEIDIPKTTTTPPPPPPPTPTPPPPNNGGDSGKEKWTGEGTYFDPGQGSCGITNGPGDMIAAISYLQFDPHTPNGNPNNNSFCGKQARCTRDGVKFIIVSVTDTCPVCAYGDMDFSPAAYAAIGGTIAEGRIKISCQWV